MNKKELTSEIDRVIKRHFNTYFKEQDIKPTENEWSALRRAFKKVAVNYHESTLKEMEANIKEGTKTFQGEIIGVRFEELGNDLSNFEPEKGVSKYDEDRDLHVHVSPIINMGNPFELKAVQRKNRVIDSIHPLTIVGDRYYGSYSGANYLAFGLDSSEIPEAIGACDGEEMNFWYGDYKKYVIGKGSTPRKAAIDLYENQKKANSIQRNDIELIRIVIKEIEENKSEKFNSICKTTLNMVESGLLTQEEMKYVRFTLIQRYRLDKDEMNVRLVDNPFGGEWWPIGSVEPSVRFLRHVLSELTQDLF